MPGNSLSAENKHLSTRPSIITRCIMLDEFQDTDPIQAELATRMAAGRGCGPDGWEHLSVPPGRLLPPGDPEAAPSTASAGRTSATYSRRSSAFDTNPSETASLQTNFRSTGNSSMIRTERSAN